MTQVNSSESKANTLSEALNSKTKFIEVNGQKFAYRSIGTGLPVIMLNRFRGTLDTWDPAFLGGLAATFNVITIDYGGIGLSTGNVHLMFINDERCQGCC
jgi:pimeloyl-ACP methyl ester carboxylesterase